MLENVKAVQSGLNHFYSDFNLPHTPLVVDGKIGSKTKDSIKRAKYLLGYLKPFILWATGTGDVFLRRLQHPTYRLNRFAVARGIKRRKVARFPSPSIAAPEIINSGFQVQNLFGALGPPTTLVVHHGESARDTDDFSALAILRGYHQYHISEGWGGIGYHFAVTSKGTLVKLRPVKIKGAHAPPNTGRIGVVLVGNYNRDVPNAAQIRTLRWLYHSGHSVGVPSGLRLGGHRDFVSTNCPGDKLYAVLPQIRR